MRTDGVVATGGYMNKPAPSLPSGSAIDADEVRARREQAAAERAARNPFNRPQGQPRSKSASRVLGDALVDHEYEQAAFTTPPPRPESEAKPAPPAPKPPTWEQTPPPHAKGPKPGPPAPAPKSGRPDIDRAGIVRDYVEDKMTMPAIAAARGINASTVRTVLVNTPGVELRDDRKSRPTMNVPAIVAEYVSGKTVAEIAASRHHGQQALRNMLRAHPDVVYRDDRATRSGGHKADDDPKIVAAVRRLYVDEAMTQQQVAERLGLTQKVVQRIMRDHDIEARPPAHERTAETMSRTNPAELMKQRLEDAGVTTSDVRGWAREHNLACPTHGVVPQRILAAYLRADGGTPSDDDLATTEARPANATPASGPPDAPPPPVPRPADDVDDIDEHLAAITDLVRVRNMLTDAGAPTMLLDNALHASTTRVDAVVTHELETLRLLTAGGAR